MKCPFCSAIETGVLDSRATELEAVIRRRRECAACKRRFTTYERVEAEPIFVVKKDGTREEFSREKLLSGVITACKKSPLPITTLENFISSIERNFHDEGRREIDAKTLGDIVLSGLKLLDPVAYVRFASVYHEFDSIDSFRKVLSAFEQEAGHLPSRAEKK